MKQFDKALGMDASITRRDFLGSTLIGAGGALVAGASGPVAFAAGAGVAFDPWTGFGGVGDYASSNGNTVAVRDAAHRVRDEHLGSEAQDTGEIYDLVIVGGGFSGLAAAYEFQRHAPGKRCLILDNHNMFGGEARLNEFDVGGHRLYGPQGSNGFLPPQANSTLSDEVWRDVGMPMSYDFAEQGGSGKRLRSAWDSYDAMYWGQEHTDTGHYFKGSGWVRNVWDDDLARVPWDAKLRADMLRAFKGNEVFHSSDGLEAWLDSMSYHEYLNGVMGLDKRVAAYTDPILAISNYGVCGDAVSAYGAYLLGLPGMKGYLQADNIDFDAVKIMSFPGGNTVYARRIAQHLIPGCLGDDDSFVSALKGRVNFSELDASDQAVRIRLGATGFRVTHAGKDRVVVNYLQNGTAYSVRTRTAVVSAGGYIARKLVPDMPQDIRDAYADFNHGPALVVNVALNNWRFLQKIGITAGRWYDGFGFFGSIRAPMSMPGATPPFDPDKPVVMTFYVPFLHPGYDTRTQGNLGRAELLGKSYADFERQIREHMNTLFAGGGFDARRDIAGIVLNRWGHAYVSPQPGFYYGGRQGEGLAAPIKAGFDRIFFGHSELGSRMNYRNAIAEGGRAGKQAALRL
ncbi:FAD/NAD(P)-binding protein [Congregibacter brevis]|uniref:FAD/NAD(P)-binding protein n=1 Tax=Congregibacter brevis TaxID=3081201 RepID=A0ABZ0IF82_9GAMM|nr:FAD/NAD(P)-binding protein [Congregibacter sp. IMCC45268]